MTINPEGERNEQRLQKIVAAAGIASRRKAEELITSGRVQVNGQTVTELGSKADPERDHVRVDGKLLKKPQQFRYFMLNKPKWVVTTVSDPEGRPTVMKFFARAGARVFPVGRLDYQSEGLLLMTNDGELANVLTSAASQVEKTYLVKVSGKPTEGELEQLRRGVMIERGRRGEREGRVMTQPAKISLVRDADNPWYEVVLTEGKNREIRKMFEEVGHFVEKVRRVGFGPLVLDVPPGETRELSDEEVTQRKRASRRKAASGAEKPARRPRSGPAALPRPVRKRIKTRSSPSNK
jgi:23S rRNA pseudouridine2605 synthase